MVTQSVPDICMRLGWKYKVATKMARSSIICLFWSVFHKWCYVTLRRMWYATWKWRTDKVFECFTSTYCRATLLEMCYRTDILLLTSTCHISLIKRWTLIKFWVAFMLGNLTIILFFFVSPQAFIRGNTVPFSQYILEICAIQQWYDIVIYKLFQFHK